MSIEERVLKLSMDDGDFIDSADNVIEKMAALKDSLSFDDVSASGAALAAFSGVGNTINGVVGTAVEGASAISTAFNDAWALIYSGFMQTIGYNLANKVTELVNACTIEPVTAGWSKYEESVNSVQKMLVNTDLTIEQVEERMNVLATYSDQTSYSYTGMAQALSSFISAGVDIDKSVTGIIGLSNWAATAGVNASTAQGAYDMFAKAVSAGSMSLQQWSSLSKTYGMGTTLFYDKLEEIAIAQEKVKKNTDGTLTSWNALKECWDSESYETMDSLMYSTLKNKWMDQDLMFEVLKEFGSDTQDIMELISTGDVTTVSEAVNQLGTDLDGFGYNAMKAAQEAKTWTDVMGSWKDAVSTAWRGTFENLFGDYEEAASFWTDVCDTLGGFFWDLPYALTDVTEAWHDQEMMLGDGSIFKMFDENGNEFSVTNYQAFTNAILDLSNAFLNLKYTFQDAWGNVFGELDADILGSATTKFAEFGYLMENVWLSPDNLERIGQVLENLFSPIKALIDLIGGLIGVVTGSGQVWEDEWGNIHETFGWVAVVEPIVKKVFEYIELISEGLANITKAFNWTKSTNGETSIEHLVSLFKEFWDMIKEIAGIIGDGILSFLGLDKSVDESGLVSGIDTITKSCEKLGKKLRYLKSPMEAVNEFLEPKAEELGLTKSMKDLNGEFVDVSAVIAQSGTDFEDVKDLFNDDSWDLVQAIYGGDSPEEAWNNVLDLWDKVTKDQTGNEGLDLADRLFNGQTFGQAMETYINGSDVSYWDLFVQKIKDKITNLPTLSGILQDVWSGFTNANEKYGFNLPTSWEEAIDYVGGIIDKIKSLIDEKLTPLFDSLFSEGEGDKVEASGSIFERIGELLAIIGGAYTNWNTDRWSDFALILSSVGDIFAIIKDVATAIIDIGKTTGDGSSTTSGILVGVDAVSGLITSVVEAIAVIIDAIGVTMGATDGDKVAAYKDDLGQFGTIATNIGVIIGTIMPQLIELAKNLWNFMTEMLAKATKNPDTSGLDSFLTSLNTIFTWIGGVILKVVNWANDFLTSGYKEEDVTKATGIIGKIAPLLSAIITPLINFVTNLNFDEFDFSKVGIDNTNQSPITTLGQLFVEIAKNVVDVGVQLAGVVTEGVAEVVCNTIGNITSIITTLFKNAKLIITAVKGLGSTGLAFDFAKIWVYLRSFFTVNNLFSTLSAGKSIVKQKRNAMIAEWINDYATVLLKIGAFLAILIACVFAVSKMLDADPAGFWAAFGTIVAMITIVAAVIAGLYWVFSSLTETTSIVNKDGKFYDTLRTLDRSGLFDSLTWAGFGIGLMALAALFGVVIIGLIALTAVTSLCPNGLKTMIVSAITVMLIVMSIVGMVIAVMAVMFVMAKQGRKYNIGEFIAQFFAIALIVGALVAIAVVMVLVIETLMVVCAGIEAAGGDSTAIMGKALLTLLAAVGIIILMFIGISGIMTMMSNSNTLASMAFIGKFALIIVLVAALAFLIEAMLAGIALVMTAMAAANNLEWGTIAKGFAIIIGILGVIALIIGAVYLICKSKSLTAFASTLGASIVKPLLLAAVVILAVMYIFKKIISAITTLSMLKMGNIDVNVLWHLVAVMAVLMALSLLFVKVILHMELGQSATAAVAGTIKTMVGVFTTLIGVFTLLTWVCAKYGTENIDTKNLWGILAILVVVAAIVVALALVCRYVLRAGDIDELMIMTLGIAVLSAVLIAMALTLNKARNINTDGMWTLVGMLAVISLIVVGLAAVAHFLTTDADIGELVVLMVGVIALFMALILAAKVLSEIKDVDTGSIDAIQSIVNALIAIAGIAALIGMLISLIPGIGPLAVGLGALFAIAIGAGVLLFAAAIYIVAAALKKLSEVDPNKITAVFSAISEGLGTLFNGAGAIVDVLLGIAVGLVVLRYAAGPILSVIGMMMLAIIVIIAIIAAAVIASGQDVDEMLGTISTIIDKVAEAIPGWFDSILTATGDCMVKLAEFVGTYTPIILEAVIGGIKEAIGGGVKLLNEFATNQAYQDMVKNPSGSNIAQAAKDETRNEFDIANSQNMQDLDAENQYLYKKALREKIYEYNEEFGEGKRIKSISIDESGTATVNYIEDSINEAYQEGNKDAYVDWLAEYMSDGSVWGEDNDAHVAFDQLLQTQEERARFAEKYPELMRKIVEETGYMDESMIDDLKDTDYWSKFGQYATEGADEAEAEVEESTEGFMSDVKAAIMDKLGGGEGGFLSSIFENINLGDSLGNWGSVIDGLGLGSFLTEDGSIDTSALLNVTTKLNLTDENGNVVDSSSANRLNELLSNAGISSESGAVLDVNTLLNSVITGEELTYNGQVLDLSSGDLGTVLAGLVTEQAAETETPAIVTNDVVVEGNTIFNTEDILGDAEVLNTTGVATYESTGQALGAALVKGFYSYYSNIKTKGAVMGSGAVNGVRGKYSAMYSAGKYLCEGFVNAIDDYLGTKAAYRAGQKLGTSAVNGLNNAIAAASPSRKAYQSGIWFGQGAVNGMMDMVTSCFDAGEELGEASLAGYTTASSVTPVIDTSAFKNGVGVINDTFAEASALNADYTVSVQGRMKSTKDMLAEAFTGLNSSLDGISGKMGFSECIDRLGDRIGEMGFYVDGKQFARAMAEHNDTALARTYVRRGRS